MFTKIRNYVMHRTNPLHFFSRAITFLTWYDRLWAWIFREKARTKRQIVSSIVAETKRRKSKKSDNL